MIVSDLFERRFEDQPLLVKLSVHAHDPDIFVTFTDMLKVGINPSSEWDDPVGIYLYPVQEIMSGKTSNNGHIVPFAADRPYAYIVRATGNMLELQDYDENDLDRDIETIQKRFWSMLVAEAPAEDGVEDPVAYWEHLLMNWYERWSAHPGAAFWRITQRMANYVERRFPSRASRVLWHQMIRACGYDGVVDRGQKIISPNEPAQAVILHTGALTVLEAVRNDLSGRRR